MLWTSCLSLGLCILAGSLVLACIQSVKKYEIGRLLTPGRIFMLGLGMAIYVLFLPIVQVEIGYNGLEVLLVSLIRTISLFFFSSGVTDIMALVPEENQIIHDIYCFLLPILYLLAPIMSFGLVLSFFKNLSAYKQYITSFFAEGYVFSELNEKSVAMATSLLKNKPKGRFVVFTDVYEQNKDERNELLEQAKVLGAICFKKDITSIEFGLHNPASGLHFFLFGDNETKNAEQALHLTQKLKKQKNTHLYVLTSQPEAEIMLADAFDRVEADGLKIRRVNEVRSLIYGTLYNEGYEKVFGSAIPAEGGQKDIHAVVVGMGRCGTEMFKALSWLCQMDGYRLRVDGFEKDSTVKSRFYAQYPELMAFSGRTDLEGEVRYTLQIHDKAEVGTAEFEQELLSLPRATYVFVALGNDELNIATALRLRTLYARAGYHPVIQTVVYSTDKKNSLLDARNFKGQPYQIDYLGDVETFYSEEVMLHQELEELAKARHLKWGSEKDFWKYDYYYKSSISSAIHRAMKVKCGIPGADKPPVDRTPAEREAIRVLEHRRWNAYVRSEGYVYSKELGRNDLAKTHNCLVPFGELSPEEQKKDDD